MNLNETAQRILSELEEAGAENITSTMNTVFDPTGDGHEVDDIKDALEQLMQLNLVVIAYAEGPSGALRPVSKEKSLSELSDLTERVKFNGAERLWNWDKDKARAQILATELGIKRAAEILDERGYQWWRQKQ